MIKKEVGFNAGHIIDLLATKGKLSLRQIGEITHYKEFLIMMATGWLLRENKIVITNEGGGLFFELNHSKGDLYY